MRHGHTLRSKCSYSCSCSWTCSWSCSCSDRVHVHTSARECVRKCVREGGRVQAPMIIKWTHKATKLLGIVEWHTNSHTSFLISECSKVSHSHTITIQKCSELRWNPTQDLKLIENPNLNRMTVEWIECFAQSSTACLSALQQQFPWRLFNSLSPAVCS